MSATAAAPPATDRVVVPIGTSLAESERNIICATLERCGGNKTRAAEVLGVSLKTLYNRLHEYGTGFSRPSSQQQSPPPRREGVGDRRGA
jgi:DNA-binding NtrC family response regulator